MTLMVLQAVCCVIKEINRSACVIWLGFADTAGLGPFINYKNNSFSCVSLEAKGVNSWRMEV